MYSSKSYLKTCQVHVNLVMIGYDWIIDRTISTCENKSKIKLYIYNKIEIKFLQKKISSIINFHGNKKKCNVIMNSLI